jgi:hypothetical protein
VLILAATIAWARAIPAAAQGAGRYVEVEYPPSAEPGELQVGVTVVTINSAGLRSKAATQ